jgi:hypothetical protein
LLPPKKEEEENQHSGVCPRARERKLVIGNLCFSLSFFQVLSLFDLIFSLEVNLFSIITSI